MTTQERNAKVDRLLHDADIEGAAEDAERMMAKYHALLNEAQSIDPRNEAPAWEEADV